MTVHTLKCNGAYFDALLSGQKTFEVRRDDRGFQKGDILVLERWDADKGRYSVDAMGGYPITLRRRIAYILTGGQLGIEPGFVVMALRRA